MLRLFPEIHLRREYGGSSLLHHYQGASMDPSNFEPLYTAEQTRALDRCAIEGHDVPGITLENRPGQMNDFVLPAL